MATAETSIGGISNPGQVYSSARPRLQCVDALRGAVMILMAIDHIRDCLSSAAMSFSPTDLTRTTTTLFFTRWITHFCAPVFAFTAGIGVFLWANRGRTKAQLSRFLVTRGIWLIVLELTLLRWVLYLDVRFSNAFIILSVIWMLGLCMVVLAALVHLPARVLAALSIVTIAGHNLLDGLTPARFGSWAWAWDILHQQAVFRVLSNTVLVAYPLVPWVAVMAAGYCLGPVFLREPARRQSFLIELGVALTVGFVLLRAWNRYGDPSAWSVQPSAWFTVLSFLNCTKYPPSLDFLLMTLGPAMIALAWFDRIRLSTSNPLIVFGRVPFFYFVIHLAVAHAFEILLTWFRYGKSSFLFLPPPSMGGPRQLYPTNFGDSLWVVYAVWLVVVVMLYPLCRWFAQLKQRRRDWWLSYL